MEARVFKGDARLTGILTEIKQLVVDASHAMAMPVLSKGINTIIQSVAQPVFEVTVGYLSSIHDDFARTVAHWLVTEPTHVEEMMVALQKGGGRRMTINQSSFQLEYQISAFENILSTEIGKIKPLVLVILLSSDDSRQADCFDKLEALMADYSFVILISEDTGLLPQEKRLDWQGQIPRLEVVEAPVLQGMAQFNNLPNDVEFFALLNTAFNFNCMQAAETLFSVLGLALEQEERNLKARKVMNQQQLLKIQTKSGQNFYDLSAQIKNLVTTQLSQLEKGLTETLENAIRPQVGSFFNELELVVKRLENLERDKGAKNVQLKIPADIENEFFSFVRKYFLKAVHDSLIVIRDGLKTIEQDIEKICSRHNMPSPVLNIRYLTEQQLKMILDSTIRWERAYEGSEGKKGLYEYFMAMRKYQMLFFMVASTFGLSFRSSLRLYMIPLSILLVGIGGFNVYKTVEKESEENEIKELEKARECIRNEAKRMGTEVVRQWTRILSDYLRQQSGQIIQTAEIELKEYAGRKAADEEEEKKMIQKQTQTIDNAERRFGNIIRNKETIFKNLQRAKAEARQAFTQQSRKVAFK